MSEFLSSFGVNGNERLPISDQQSDDAADSETKSHQSAAAIGPIRALPDQMPFPAHYNHDEADSHAPVTPVRPVQTPSRSWRTPVLFACLAVITVAGYLLRDTIVPQASRWAESAIDESSPMRPVADTLFTALGARPAAPLPSESSPVSTQAAPSEVDALPTTNVAPDPVIALPTANVAPDPVLAVTAAQAPAEIDSAAAEAEFPIDTNTPATQAAPIEQAASVKFAAEAIQVSESGAAARIVVVREGQTDTPVTFTWWVTSDTAIGDDDFADLGARTETLAGGEVSQTLFIPIVADSRPEDAERFFVTLTNAEDPQALQLQKEVLIIDDDS